jgi:hypothetical protein
LIGNDIGCQGYPADKRALAGGPLSVIMRDRLVDWFMAHERIEINSQIMGGKPVIRGTRVRVNDILDLLSSGASRAEILDDYTLLGGR